MLQTPSLIYETEPRGRVIVLRGIYQINYRILSHARYIIFINQQI